MKKFEDIEVSYSIGIGFSGCNKKDTRLLSDYLSEEEYSEMTENDLQEFLGEVLETEIENCLDAAIWIKE